MKIARMCACSLITGGLLFTGMTVHANPSSGGTQSGAMEGSSGGTGSSSESMKKDNQIKQGNKNKMGKDSSGREKESSHKLRQSQESDKPESPRCSGPPSSDDATQSGSATGDASRR